MEGVSKIAEDGPVSSGLWARRSLESNLGFFDQERTLVEEVCANAG